MKSPRDVQLIREELDLVYAEQEKDEWPLAKQRRLRAQRDLLEAELREALDPRRHAWQL